MCLNILLNFTYYHYSFYILGTRKKIYYSGKYAYGGFYVSMLAGRPWRIVSQGFVEGLQRPKNPTLPRSNNHQPYQYEGIGLQKQEVMNQLQVMNEISLAVTQARQRLGRSLNQVLCNKTGPPTPAN